MNDPGTGEKVDRFLQLVANNDAEGYEFLRLWHQYCHSTDDTVDENRWDAESLLALFMLACETYSHKFYVRNRAQLQMPMLVATNIYADSVIWEKDPALWKRQWCEVLRHSGNDVFFAVAIICGGWEHVRKISRSVWAACYIYHKDLYSTPQ